MLYNLPVKETKKNCFYLEAAIMTIRDGYYVNKSLISNFLVLVHFLLMEFLDALFGVYLIPHEISVNLLSVGMAVYKLVVKMIE